MATQYKTIDRITHSGKLDIHSNGPTGNGKCDREHPLMDKHEKKKK